MLIANEPRSYRETVAAVLAALRPHVEVLIVEPCELDREVIKTEPHLVLCSHPTEQVAVRVVAWVVLYPGGESHAEVSIGGVQRTVDGIELDGLLCLVDRVERLVQAD